MKRAAIALYIVVVAVMAAATIIEKYEGTSYVSEHIYDAWWFSLLWALLAAAAVFWFVRQRVRRVSVVCLHLSFLLILAGALLTHVTSRQGMVHLRIGEQTSQYVDTDMRLQPLPFTLRLDTFEVKYHAGTQSPADYVSRLTVGSASDPAQAVAVTVSMNNILARQGIRLYQSSFDDDMGGTLLAMSSDPWGIPVTYCGYALLFISFLWILVDPRGTFRAQLRSLQRAGEATRTAATAALLLMCLSSTAAAPTLPRQTAARFGRLNMLYNDRVCPVETYALDFTKKLCGSRSYQGLTPEQVLTGFIFWADEWADEPVIKVKGSELKQALSLPDYASVNNFFRPDQGYILGPYLQAYYQGRQEPVNKQAAKLDDRLTLIMALRQGTPLRLFPYAGPHQAVTWYSPTSVDSTVQSEHRRYMQDVFSLINADVHAGHIQRVDTFFSKMQLYQQRYGGKSVPTASRQRAEHLYNSVPFATILFMFNLALGLLSLCLFIARLSSARPARLSQWPFLAANVLLVLSWLALTVALALRWIVTAHVPMANGYETMLLLAWLVMLITLLLIPLAGRATHLSSLLTTFGFLLSGFFLLVSHINQMDPQIGHLMPVLNSPLLSLHVSVIMMSFALLAITFMCGLTGLFIRRNDDFLTLVTQFSLLLLYPALATLAMGIFIGAIWANISWGTYWSWDPKEVWALITLMVYSVAVHRGSLPWLRRPRAYHLYMVLAFLTILMTYFGVNYFLGGMHSYA